MSKKQKKELLRLIEATGTTTLTALWEYARMEKCPYKDNSAETCLTMLIEIGKAIRKLRYEQDVAWAGIRSLQQDNDRLKQLSLFSESEHYF